MERVKGCGAAESTARKALEPLPGRLCRTTAFYGTTARKALENPLAANNLYTIHYIHHESIYIFTGSFIS